MAMQQDARPMTLRYDLDDAINSAPSVPAMVRPKPQSLSARPRWWSRRRKLDPEQLFLEHLELIERTARSAGRRSGFKPQDIDDFVSSVTLKLIEDEYRVLRQHRGESRFTTYLVAVVHNYCRDYRDHLWGRFRPSAAAKRLGTPALVLERLLVRDDLDLNDAIEIARTHYELNESEEALRQLAAQLPPRSRRRFVGEDSLTQLSVAADDPSSRMEHIERRDTAREVEAVLSEALNALDAQDLLILKMHLGEGATLAAIAQILNLKQRQLYSRKDRCLQQLRRYLISRGLTWERVRDILGWEENELQTAITTTGDDTAATNRTDP
ncbi:MAG: sigma-70 family RNA polymerase sigma factor [Actinomycetota bacterium]